MNVICERAADCGDETCPHAQPHGDCDHECQRVAGARCVVDTADWPVFGERKIVAIFIRRRKAA